MKHLTMKTWKKNLTYINYFDNYNLLQITEFINLYFDNIDLDSMLSKDDFILIKPNLVSSALPIKSITTHPVIIEAIVVNLKNRGYVNIGIGDSGIVFKSNIFTLTGMEEIANKYDCRLLNFDKEEQVVIYNENNKWIKKIPIAKSVLDAKIIINVPKAKTHQGFTYTGAVKNLYGLVYGDYKRKIHKIAQKRMIFDEILIDICSTFAPVINIMDSIYGMDGNGPISGNSIYLGMIIASDSALQLDLAFLSKMSTPTAKVSYIETYQKKVNSLVPNKIIDPDKNVHRTWLLPSDSNTDKPCIDHSKCIGCNYCSNICPQNAIMYKNNNLCIDYLKCIRCYCCSEICTEGAIARK
jgi:uncharacterized protein (DUF362 family)